MNFLYRSWDLLLFAPKFLQRFTPNFLQHFTPAVEMPADIA